MNKTMLDRLALVLISMAVLFSLSLYSLTGSVHAQNETDAGVDAVFVMDTSYSMNATDQDRIAAEVIKMFMDMSETTRTRIGFVAYNHKIVESQALTSLATEEQKTQLKKKIAGLRFSGYTDLGLGLSRGEELVEGAKDSSTRPIMILLSDGGTDFGPIPSGRTVEDSNKDVERVIGNAQAEGFPIYTIGLNHDGSVNAPQLETIATKTGGTSFITESAADLPEIFNKIFAKQIRSTLVPVATVTATGELQEVTVQIPNSSMNEANIILLSLHPIAETHLYSNAKNVRFYKSDKYSLMKMPQPQKGGYLLKFKGTAGDIVKINLLDNYGLKAKLEIAQAIKGVPTKVTSSLIHAADGTLLTDADVYQSVKSELIIKDLSTNQEERIPMNLKENGYEVDTIFKHSGKYYVSLWLSSPDFYRETAVSELELTNKAPEAIGDGAITLNKEEGEARINLADYFKDANQDKLSYVITSNNNDKSAFSKLDDGTLLVTPTHTGDATITLTVTDPEGGSITSDLNMTVHSIWTRYIIAGGIVLAILLAGGLAYLMLRPRPKFTGRLEGYFLNTASGNDIPVKYWPLASFEKQRSIRLSQLFTSLDINEPLPEAENIYVEAGKNGTLLLKHNTRCTVEKGKTPIVRNKKEPVSYNDKIYITFEDRITEIELRYKEIKPNSLS
jgi:Mg-chelatase subunit ChlD